MGREGAARGPSALSPTRVRSAPPPAGSTGGKGGRARGHAWGGVGGGRAGTKGLRRRWAQPSVAAGEGRAGRAGPGPLAAMLAALRGALLLCGALCGARGAALTLAVVLPERNLSYPWAWPRVGPAVRLAAAAVNARGDLLAGHALRWVFGSSEDRHGLCSEMAAPLAAVDLRFAHHPAAFVGPGCVYAAAPVARFTSHWGLPLLTAGAEAHGFDDKREQFALTTRVGPSHRKLGELGARLHRHYGWARRALLVYWDERMDDRPCFFAAEGLYMQLPAVHNMTVLDVVFRHRGNYSFIIQEIRQKGRGECGGCVRGAEPRGGAPLPAWSARCGAARGGAAARRGEAGARGCVRVRAVCGARRGSDGCAEPLTGAHRSAPHGAGDGPARVERRATPARPRSPEPSERLRPPALLTPRNCGPGAAALPVRSRCRGGIRGGHRRDRGRRKRSRENRKRRAGPGRGGAAGSDPSESASGTPRGV